MIDTLVQKISFIYLNYFYTLFICLLIIFKYENIINIFIIILFGNIIMILETFHIFNNY